MTLSLIKTSDIRLTNRQRRREQAHFEKVRNAQNSYSAALNRIARQVSELIRHYSPITPAAIQEIEDTLNRYAHLIRPWAASTATQMIAEVARRDETAWARHSSAIGRSLRFEVQRAPIAPVVRRIQQEQVNYITSLPIEAAQEVQRLAMEAYLEGTRFEGIVEDIEEQLRLSDRIKFKTEQQLHNRATLIARTEVAKTSTAITQARAKHIGSNTYKWRTARDADVRPAHKRLEGKTYSWDDPPIAEDPISKGIRHHPGEFPNCRCFPEPVVDHLV